MQIGRGHLNSFKELGYIFGTRKIPYRKNRISTKLPKSIIRVCWGQFTLPRKISTFQIRKQSQRNYITFRRSQMKEEQSLRLLILRPEVLMVSHVSVEQGSTDGHKHHKGKHTMYLGGTLCINQIHLITYQTYEPSSPVLQHVPSKFRKGL